MDFYAFPFPKCFLHNGLLFLEIVVFRQLFIHFCLQTLVLYFGWIFPRIWGGISADFMENAERNLVQTFAKDKKTAFLKRCWQYFYVFSFKNGEKPGQKLKLSAFPFWFYMLGEFWRASGREFGGNVGGFLREIWKILMQNWSKIRKPHFFRNRIKSSLKTTLSKKSSPLCRKPEEKEIYTCSPNSKENPAKKFENDIFEELKIHMFAK